MRKMTGIALLCGFSLVFSQANTWVKQADSGGAQYRSSFALTYDPAADHFLMTLGIFWSPYDLTGPYIDQAFSLQRGKWMNLLPDPRLYGVWVDSFGTAPRTSSGAMTYYPASLGPLFVRSAWNGETWLRPTTYCSVSWIFFQTGAYNPSDRCTYYCWGGHFARYNNATRIWDTLSGGWKPPRSWRWGQIVHDGLNNELVLFGGGNIDTLGGSLGTRVYSFATQSWRLLDLPVQPLQRANAAMAYDDSKKKIVLFGGDHLDSLLSDTWVYDCAARSWEKKNPPLSPSPRMGHKLLYLPKSRSVVLIGGSNYTSTTGYMQAQYRSITPYQVWKYDLTADRWALVRQLSTGDSIPRVAANMPQNAAVDTADNILLVDGRGSTWRMACDPAVEDASGTATLGVAQNTQMRRSGCGWIPEWFTTGVAAPDTAATEAGLRALPANVWTKLNPPKYHGFAGFDWGTTVFDHEHDIILSWNGGHSTNPGNQVVHYSVPENRLSVGYDAEFPMEACYSNTSYPTLFTFAGRPFINVHTYQEYIYDDNLHRMLIIHDRTYLYDPIRKDFDSARIPIHPEMSTTYCQSGLMYSPSATLCWSLTKFFSLDSGTRVWRKLPVTGRVPTFYADNCEACFDETRNRLWLYQSGNLFAFNLSSNTVDTIHPLNSRPAGTLPRREMAYVKSQDKIFFPPISTTEMLVYNCAANAWETLPVSLGSGLTYASVDASSPSLGIMVDEKRNMLYLAHDGKLWMAMRPDYAAAVETGGAGTGTGALSFSFANPFVPGSAIRLNGLARAARLTVTDIRGRTVAEIGAAGAGTGLTRLSWDAKNAGGGLLPAGIYFLRAVTGGKNFVRPLLLVR